MNIPGLPSFDKITFGPGVIGRTGPIVAVGMLCLTAIAYMTPVNEAKIAAGIADFIIILAWLFASFRHANNHPSTSVMEGGEAVAYHRQEMIAKGFVVDALPEEVKEVTSPPERLISGGNADA